ncbi:MAG: NAD(P)H-dependent oxidoreductase [Gilvibacter sp.]
MKNIIAFGGSNSKSSINKQLAAYTAQQITDATVHVLDLNDYELPLYGIDLEQEQGIPNNAQLFLDKIKQADGLVISLAEHNGAYSAAFKNVFDWMSRIDGKLWSDVPMLLMATSPGGRGGATVLDIAANRFPYMGGNVVATYSLPMFNANFSDNGIVDSDLASALEKAIATFKNAVFS